jgi:hypothetical protein
MSSASSFVVFSGELSLVAAQLSATGWEGALRRLASEGPALDVRSLKLDDNELGGSPASVLAEALVRLEHLAELSVCDARLGSAGASKLLSALASVPAFARPHAEVWAPIETKVQPPQGARLCLMRNDITDTDLRGHQPAGARPLELRGVVELALSGNALVGDAGVVTLGTLVPNVRRLFLGRTGVSVEKAGALGVDGSVGATIESSWPMLEALALNGCPIDGEGFERLAKALHARARNVQTKKLLPPKAAGGGAGAAAGGGAGAEPAHSYCHLDVRENAQVAPQQLSQLLEKMKEYAREQAGQSWIRAQPFGGGRHRSEGLVLCAPAPPPRRAAAARCVTCCRSARSAASA